MTRPASMILPGGYLKSAKKIAFRVDASGQIGTGHFMRCLTLADTLREQGAQIRFVSREPPAYLRDMLATKGIELALLSRGSPEENEGDLAHSRWLWTSQAQDAQATIQAISDQQWDWIVVDHYALDTRWENTLRAITKQIMVIDDIADRQHDCDVLLDQNFYADMQTRYVGKVPAHCQLLLGPRYALLRGEFKKLREQAKRRTGLVKKILVFFGGVDADNYTELAIQALDGFVKEGVQVDVVIGAQHPCRSQIEAMCAIQGSLCHVQTTRMAELMAAADLAIGAGGSASWERCCLGLPALSVCVADNQRKQIAAAAEEGLLYAPTSDSDLVALLQRHTKVLLENQHLLKLISHTALKAVDGNGVARIVSVLNVSNIEIRTANEKDSQDIFDWRNHPTILSVSRCQHPIAWEDHRKWFESVQSDEDRELLIGCIDNEAVGVVRFDKKGDTAEVSIYLAPDGGFSGQGRNLLCSAEGWLRTNCPDVKRIRASVLGENSASQRLFIGANYRLETVGYVKDI